MPSVTAPTSVFKHLARSGSGSEVQVKLATQANGLQDSEDEQDYYFSDEEESS
jgi:hypothetical protein